MRPAAAALAALLTAPMVRGDDATPVTVKAGETVDLCKAGLAHCPVSAFLCDDPKVAVIENAIDGAVLKGLAAGTTLCSVLGYERAFRRVMRVTVEAP